MKIVSIYDFFQKFPDEEAARVLIVEAIKFQNAKIISRCLIDAKNAENISLLELEQF